MLQVGREVIRDWTIFLTAAKKMKSSCVCMRVCVCCVELISVTTCCYYWFPFQTPHLNYCLTYPLVASSLKLIVNSLVLGAFPVLL
ncbi:unnamed protein product [Bubo scandiacus]